MKDPVKDPARWTDTAEPTAFERDLLEAAMRDQIPNELKARMASALDASLAGGAALTAPAAGAGGGLLFSKTAAIGLASALLVSGAIGWQVWRAAQPAGTAGAPQPSAAADAPAAREPTSIAAVALQPSAAAAPEQQPAAALRQEIALLDACRQAVKHQSPARALDLLARYDQRFPRGTLVPEASALRIEALVQAGASERARELAEKFLESYPASPLAQRVERSVASAGRAVVDP